MGPEERTLPPRSVLVVMPAYNAARTLADTWKTIPADVVHEVLLVDDHSVDATVDVATRLAIRTLVLPHNVGYGGNQKACYLKALRLGAEVVVMLHPDGQYDPKMIPSMVQPILDGEADLVLGSRMLIPGGARRGRMPLYRYVSNKALTWVENHFMRTSFSELHTGYRAYSRRFLQTVPFLRNSNDFVFDTEVLAQAVVFRRPRGRGPHRDPLPRRRLLHLDGRQHPLRARRPGSHRRASPCTGTTFFAHGSSSPDVPVVHACGSACRAGDRCT